VSGPVALVAGKGYVIPAGYIGSRLAVISGIDLKAIGAPGVTPIYTPPAGQTAIYTAAYMEITAGPAATPATGGLGIASGESDVFAPVSFTGVLVVGQVWAFLSNGLSRTGPGTPTTTISYGNDVAATGAGAVTGRLHLFGFLF